MTAAASRPDPLSPEQRRRCMANNRGRDTTPELILRKALHAAGRRYRLQDRSLPGRPDMVFPRSRAVAFVHGCFWHGHDCPMFKLPRSNRSFWADKIRRNRERDQAAVEALERAGWRVLVAWECALRGRARLPPDQLVGTVLEWLDGERASMLMQGLWHEEGRIPGFSERPRVSVARSDAQEGCMPARLPSP